MMKINVFGIGAAGNKAAITAIEQGTIAKEAVKLVNTTVKDIPDEYKQNDSSMVVQFSSMLGGCGKEPNKGKQAITEAITSGKIDFSKMVSEDINEIVLVTSTEGGTGCGATPVIAKYFSMMNLPVHVFAFIGFQDEARGINNSLKFFKELGNSSIVLHTIMNDQFLDYTQSYTTAEQAANKEFARQLQILIGSEMIPSSQNIDDTDLFKVTSTSGYMDIKHIYLNGVKNKETFNEAIVKAYDNGKSLKFDKSSKRMACIINASEDIQQSIDDRFDVVKRYIGEPYEKFLHIQNNGEENYIDIIAAGMNFPEQAIIDISKKYAELKQKVSTTVKSFDDIFSGIDVDDEDEFSIDLQKKNKNVNKLFSDFVNGNAVKVAEEKPAKSYGSNKISPNDGF